MNNGLRDNTPIRNVMPKTFGNLIHEVRDEGRCTQCGACVTFCKAVNYGALGLDPDGVPYYADRKKCIECGHCYMICPARDPFEDQLREYLGWRAPVGQVMDVSVACASDNKLRQRGTNGGVVTALLLHLLDTGHIDGAVVTRQQGLFQRQPYLATTCEEIIAAAGSRFDNDSNKVIGGNYNSTFSPSIQALGSLRTSGLRRIAFVGLPCQIKTLRKMQIMGILPADTVHLSLGLFCSGSYTFDEIQKRSLETAEGFLWKEAVGMHLRDNKLNVELKDGSLARIGLDRLTGMRRSACSHCQDFSADFADLSFGSSGAPEAWTTVVVRTPMGRAAFTDAMGIVMNEYRIEDNPHFAKEALQQVQAHAAQKKAWAQISGYEPPEAVNYGSA